MPENSSVKRVPCPFCKELIAEGAIKCRFCGEMLNVQESEKNKPKQRLFLKAVALYILPIPTFILFMILSSPLQPHCSIGKGIYGCTPVCEPTEYFEDGRPSSYKKVPCFHGEPHTIDQFMYDNFSYILIFILFLLIGAYLIDKKKLKSFLTWMAFGPIKLFGQNLKNNKVISKIIVNLMLLPLILIWMFGYFFVAKTLIGKPFVAPSNQQATNQAENSIGRSIGPIELIETVNQERQKNGLLKLNHNEELSLDAKNYAQYMCNDNSEKKDFFSFTENLDDKYNLVSFNFDFNPITFSGRLYDEKKVVERWLENTTSKENILSDEVTDTGVGVVACRNKDIIIQVFASLKEKKAKKQPPPSSTINKKHSPNFINCTGPDGVVFQTTQEECDSFNKAWDNVPSPSPNEYIRCNISPNCGGGYKEMTRANCEKIICCQLNNSWELRDKDQCKSEQRKEICDEANNPDDCLLYWKKDTADFFDCRAHILNKRNNCYNSQ